MRSMPNASLSDSHRSLGELLDLIPRHMPTVAHATEAAAGHPSVSAITRFGADGTTVTERIACDFSGVAFARDGNVLGGAMKLTAIAPSGTKRSTTAVQLLEGGQPSTASTTRYRPDGAASVLVETDYRQLEFGPGNHIIGGALQSVQTIRGAITLQTRIVFGADGFPKSISARRYGENGARVLSVAETEYGAAVFDASHRVVGGSVTSRMRRGNGTLESATLIVTNADLSSVTRTTEYAADGTTPERSYVIDYRPDRSLERVAITAYADGKPRQTRTIDYADHETTPVLTTVADFVYGAVQGANDVVSVRETATRRDGTLSTMTERTVADDGWSQTVTSRYNTEGDFVGLVVVNSRPDGTRSYQRDITADITGRVRRVVATTFLRDGTTVNERSASDFAGVHWNGHQIAGGAVSTVTSRSNQTAKALTTTQFTS